MKCPKCDSVEFSEWGGPTCLDCGHMPGEYGYEPDATWPWLNHAIACCDSWRPDARLIGNVPALELGRMLRALRPLSAPAREPDCSTVAPSVNSAAQPLTSLPITSGDR